MGNQLAVIVVLGFCGVGAIGVLWYTRPSGLRLLLTLVLLAVLVVAIAFLAEVLALGTGPPGLRP